jgi:Domain of unknown function (DUF4382)
MEVWFSIVRNPGREADTRAEAQRVLHPRSSRAPQESFCPLDKDLSWKSENRTSCSQYLTWTVTGTINIKAGDPKPTCMLSTANGTVRVLTHTVSTCSSCSTSSRITHIFVSVRGIEVHPSAIADDAAPDWQELMPLLQGQPLQFDLVSVAANRGARLPLGEGVTIPADVYRQLRLRFVPNQPTSKDPVPEKNACGGTGFNCVVSEDGRTYPLLFDGAPPEFRLTSERIAGGVLLIPPDSNSDLVVDFQVSWALSSFVGEGVRLLPVLIGSVSVERRPVETLEERAAGTRK